MELTGAGLYSTTGVLRVPNNSNISLFPLLYTEYDYVKIKSSGLAASGVAGYFADKALGIDEVSGRTNILHTSSLVRTIDDALKERGLFNVGARTALIYEILNPLSEFSKAYKANGGDIGKALEGVVLNQFGFDYNERLGAIVPAGIGGKKISYSREIVNEQAYSSSINMPIEANINNFTTSAAVLNISNSVLNINNYRNIPLTLRSTKKENTKSQTVMLSTNLKGGSIGGSKSSTVLEDERVMYTFLNGDNMTITIDTLTGEALQINGDNNTVTVNNAVWKSYTDAHKYATKSKSGSMAFSVINGTPLATGGSFSKGHGYEESKIVNNVAGIFGDNNTYNSNTTHMEGAIMAGDNLNANPGILTHADVEQYYKSEQKRIGVSANGGFEGAGGLHNFWVGAKSLLGKNVDFKFAKEIREGKKHATITDPTLVGAINTDLAASQEWETVKDKKYSATIPYVDEKEMIAIKESFHDMGQVYRDIGHRVKGEKWDNEKATSDNIGNLSKIIDDELDRAGFYGKEKEQYKLDLITEYLNITNKTGGDGEAIDKSFSKTLWEISDIYYELENAVDYRKLEGTDKTALEDLVDDIAAENPEYEAKGVNFGAAIKIGKGAVDLAIKNKAVREYLLGIAKNKGLKDLIKYLQEIDAKEKVDTAENEGVPIDKVTISTPGSPNNNNDWEPDDEKWKKKWHSSTFNNVEESVSYHLNKHGKGRTLQEYTKDVEDCFNNYKSEGAETTLNDGSTGIKIKIKYKDKYGKTRYKGGYWTLDGKIVTYFD